MRESAFYVDPAAALAPLWKKLDDLGISSAGSSAPAKETGKATDANRVAPEAPEAVQTGPARGPIEDPLEVALQEAELNGFIPAANPAEISIDSPGALQIREDASAVPRRMSHNNSEEDTNPESQRPYRAYGGSTWPALEASRDEILQGLLRIVDIEGPVCWSRLRTAYIHASGGQRVGRSIGEKLDSVIQAAIRRGLLVSSGRFPGLDRAAQTLRLPHQPEAVLREAGPRSLDDVPVEELRAAMTSVMQQDPERSEDFDYIARRTLNMYGRSSLTTSARKRLSPVFAHCSELALES